MAAKKNAKATTKSNVNNKSEKKVTAQASSAPEVSAKTEPKNSTTARATAAKSPTSTRAKAATKKSAAKPKKANTSILEFKLTAPDAQAVFLAGDFNGLWGNRELELFLGATGLISANFEGHPSHPSRLPKRQLDFILHSSDLEASNFNIPSVAYSDHAPLVCDFEVRKKNPDPAVR